MMKILVGQSEFFPYNSSIRNEKCTFGMEKKNKSENKQQQK